VYCMTRGAKCYTFEVLRLLQVLKNGRLGPMLAEPALGGCSRLLALPSSVLYNQIPCRASIEQEKRDRERGQALLRDLNSTALMDVPDAGVRCGKCGANDITFEFLQTRSADEGTTVYCNCNACRKRWRM
jgi:DNA-directed RNA polymerase subunit M/transcription elongation factor TFIIS